MPCYFRLGQPGGRKSSNQAPQAGRGPQHAGRGAGAGGFEAFTPLCPCSSAQGWTGFSLDGNVCGHFVVLSHGQEEDVWFNETFEVFSSAEGDRDLARQLASAGVRLRLQCLRSYLQRADGAPATVWLSASNS